MKIDLQEWLNHPLTKALKKAHQKELEAAQEEAQKQARLNGMGSERELSLMSKLEMRERSVARAKEALELASTMLKVGMPEYDAYDVAEVITTALSALET